VEEELGREVGVEEGAESTLGGAGGEDRVD